MNIQLLLSANPNQGSGASASQATGAQGLSNGLFRQAMLQANESQPRSLNELPTTTAASHKEALSEFASLLDSLGIELNQEALAELFAQLQMAEQPTPEQLAALPAVTGDPSNINLSALEEISNRLSLVAAFSDDTTLSTSSSEATSVAAIAEQLSISQQDTLALISAYQQVTGGNASVQRIDTLSQQIAALSMDNAANIEINTQSTTSNNTLNTSVVQTASTQPTAATVLTATNQLIDADMPTATTQLAAADAPKATTQLTAADAPKATTQLTAASMPTATTQLTSLSGEAVASALALSGTAGEPAPRMGGGGELAFSLPNATPQPAPAATGASLLSAIGTPVSHPAWPSQLGQQLVQFAQQGGEQHIQMKLHPAELGPLSISLKMTEHGAQAHFLSAHAQVRQVIEQAIPQLREALAEQGISLGDTSVGEQNASNEQAFAQQNTTPGSMGGDSGVDSETGIPITESAPVAIDGRVDLYA
ncbi:flagellar hook-length control protein FliK [Vreelandella venusta]|uniref:flagellar hook-length control protein FliK n=1 Tax=Vreelandella venusta TaxID=44935 RepID=UPI00384AAC6E